MIKVGQIYFHKRIEARIVITYVDNQNYELCDWIVDTGKVCTDKIDWIKQTCELIAEYPTWQEAVNSKEFNGERVMSKDQSADVSKMVEPEVGDVWEYADGYRVYVFDTEDMICALAMVKGGLCYDGFKKRKFLERHTYLGKSKVNIEQLFEVEE